MTVPVAPDLSLGRSPSFVSTVHTFLILASCSSPVRGTTQTHPKHTISLQFDRTPKSHRTTCKRWPCFPVQKRKHHRNHKFNQVNQGVRFENESLNLFTTRIFSNDLFIESYCVFFWWVFLVKNLLRISQSKLRVLVHSLIREVMLLV